MLIGFLIDSIMHYPRHNVLALILFLGSIQPGFGQPQGSNEYRFKHYTSDHGLSQITILSLYEDEHGYIWIGTRNGLNRFDGYDFQVFFSDPWDKNTLSNNHINSLTGDGNGTIWIGTSNGLTAYDQRTRVFTRYQPDQIPEDQTWSVQSLMMDKDDNLWVSSASGLYVLRTGSDELARIEVIKEVNEVTSDYFLGSVQTSDGDLWFGGHNGLMKLVEENGKPALRRIEIRHGLRLMASVNALYQDRPGELWVSEYSYVWRVNLDDLHAEATENRYVFDGVHASFESRGGFIRQDDHHIWVATYSGPILIDTRSLKYVDRLYHDPDNPLSLSDNSIHSMLVSSRNDVWLGSYSGGLNYYSSHQNTFEVFRNSPANSNSLNSDIINGFEEGPDGQLFVGTSRGGLNSWERKGNVFTSEQEHLNIRHLLMDGDHLWIGTYFDGLIKKNIRTGQYTFYKNDPSGKGIDHVYSQYSTLLDHENNLWAGAWNVIYKFDRSTDTFKRYEFQVQDPNAFQIVHHLLQVGEDIWVISNSGIHVFNLPTEKFTRRYQHESANKNSLPTNELNWGITDRKGKIWIASNVGISYFEPETESFQTLTPKDGLPSNMVVCLLADDNNNIWISTANGLTILDQQTMSFRNFSKSNNLQSTTFRNGACYTCQDGSLLFGGSNGFNRIDPTRLRSDPNPPRLVINDLTVFNKPIIPGEGSLIRQDIRYLETLQLPHDQNVFTLTYGAITFLDPDKSEYAYMMEPFESEWNQAGKKRSATYTNLEPGTYTFKVKASNGDGIWTEQPSQLTIVIVPPFWMTIWFQTLMVILVLGMIHLGYYLRIRGVRRNQAVLQRMVDARTRELSEANGELEEKNHEIQAQSEELQAQRDSLEETLSNLQKTQTQLIEAEKMASIATLTAGLAHELNNPLNYIGGMTEPIRRDLKEIEKRMDPDDRSALNDVFNEIERLLDNTTDGVNRATAVVRGLVSISPQGRNLRKNEEFELNEMITSTLSFMEKSSQHIEFKVQLDGILTVKGSKVEINQVLINLVENGIDAVKGKERAKIELVGKVDEDNVMLEVRDNGIGLPEAHQSHIFEPFFTTKSPGMGTGLGLYIAYSIIKKHQGDLQVKSVPGNGTTFTIVLPAWHSLG